jgi:hypothetical protein
LKQQRGMVFSGNLWEDLYWIEFSFGTYWYRLYIKWDEQKNHSIILPICTVTTDTKALFTCCVFQFESSFLFCQSVAISVLTVKCNFLTPLLFLLQGFSRCISLLTTAATSRAQTEYSPSLCSDNDNNATALPPRGISR